MKNKFIKNSIVAVYVLLPIIEMLRATSLKDVEIFNIAVIELVNILLISFAFTCFFFTKTDKKLKIKIILFALIFVIYLILHCINNSNFDTSILPDTNISYFVEVYYILRQYGLPLMMLMLLRWCDDIFDRDFYLKIVRYITYICCGSIVILNLCRFSYSSYTGVDNEYAINTSCIFDLINYDGKLKDLFTCGLFPSANRLSIVLLMLLPYNVMNLYYEKRIKDVLLLCLQVLAMFIIGTKTAALGAFLTVTCLFFAYFFFMIVKRKYYKLNDYVVKLACVVVFAFICMCVTPFGKYFTQTKAITNKLNDEQKVIYDNLDNVEDDDLQQYMYDNKTVFKINEFFFEYYPVENDTEFWRMIAKRKRSLNNDYRNLKVTILERVEERNNNPLDKILGMGYTINFPDAERDYIYQYYLFGISGILLLIIPYVVEYFKKIWIFLHKREFTYANCFGLLAGFLGVVGAYFSGHLFGWTGPMFILVFVMGYQKRMHNDES